jgi:hypothetical protein
MTYEECFAAILADPENDAPRAALANIVRVSDPKWAELIELQLHLAQHRRDLKPETTSQRESDLVDGNKRRWARNLDMYMGELVRNQTVEFERGLPWMCSMNPYLFLEQGGYVMSSIAPLRGIWFFDDPDHDPFPMKRIAESPLLERLDFISFQDCDLTDDDLVVFAQSSHLVRCRSVDIRNVGKVSLAVLEAFAANPQLRKCLMVSDDIRGSDGGPVGEFYSGGGDTRSITVEVGDDGRKLEQAHGYIPWLHLDNICADSDVSYFFDHHVLPRFVPGSPANQPTPYGTGRRTHARLSSRQDWLETLQQDPLS